MKPEDVVMLVLASSDSESALRAIRTYGESEYQRGAARVRALEEALREVHRLIGIVRADYHQYEEEKQIEVMCLDALKGAPNPSSEYQRGRAEASAVLMDLIANLYFALEDRCMHACHMEEGRDGGKPGKPVHSSVCGTYQPDECPMCAARAIHDKAPDDGYRALLANATAPESPK